MLGLAFFKSLVKEHGKAYFEPIGRRLQQAGMKTFSPANPMHVWTLRKELGAYSKWMVGQKFGRRERAEVPAMDARLKEHIDFAVDRFHRYGEEISGVMRKHQLKLADRQCRMAELSQRVQDTVTILVTAQWASIQKDAVMTGAADILCQDLRRKLTGERMSDRYLKDVSQLADTIIGGGFETLAGVPRAEIMMKYENK
jgi:hypothetical protein